MRVKEDRFVLGVEDEFVDEHEGDGLQVETDNENEDSR